MAAVEVARLKLCCDARHDGQARFAVEDALRTEIPDDGRLVLLRRMRIAPAGSSAYPAQRQAAVREAWAAATGGARHGGDDGAAEANCVWFASRSEAEAILLARLLAGRAAEGWFWKMALPGWRGQQVVEWLGESLGECLQSGDDRRLLALVEACVASADAETLLAALAQAEKEMPVRPWSRGALVDVTAEAQVSAAHHASGFMGAAEVAGAIPVPASLREVIRRLDHRLNATPAVRAILRAHVLRESPALALSPMLLEDVVAATLPAIVDREPKPPSAVHDTRREPSSDTSPVSSSVPTAESSPDAKRTASTPLPAEPATKTDDISWSPEPERPGEPTSPTPIHRMIVPLRSEHAGLWLVVPSLCDMGLREWLAARPDLLGDHPGRQLITALARHYRIADDDPALAVLGEIDPSRPLAEWTTLWRHGLDRWLRRKARRRLHDLIHRPGRLDWDEQRLSVIFPPGDADIRLRRLALDRDPGWTDWLGLSIRFHFRDEVLG